MEWKMGRYPFFLFPPNPIKYIKVWWVKSVVVYNWFISYAENLKGMGRFVTQRVREGIPA